jgi:hypothetical protein
LRKFGDVAPVAFIFNREKMILNMMDFSDKELALANLKKVCKELKANMVIIMAESFISKDLNDISPSIAPDREESIVVQGENDKGDTCAIIQPFYRDKKGKIILKKKMKQLAISSRWSEILK